MNVTAQNTLNPPVFEIPDPPDEFGQDGGKFYRCYDALAEEIDEDMVKGLKEQLDGMLIFAGLFAGVNSAFLGLTIPLLSADPADDANALLAQNNAILTQLVMGRNDSVPVNAILPSVEFAPSRDIFAINALFALSLAFAIISSFLAVLGRQWLVYYRKRSGGGPDRQRREQLKRFLGAERWRLEAILDDVLPSLLQIGLIIFCASLILYFRYLSPAISIIIGIPISVGLAFFIGSALCIIWDRFCPFHSPLSHLLLLAVRPLSRTWKVVRETLPIVNTVVGDRLSGRKEESPELLQTIALRRAICISDDTITLLHATANFLAVRSPATMEGLWGEVTFHQRFLELFQNAYNVILQLRGYNVDPRDIAASARRLYCCAVAHILLTLDTDWDSDSLEDLRSEVRHFMATTNLISSPLLLRSSPSLIGTNLGFSVVSIFRYVPSDEELQSIRNYLVASSDALASYPDRRSFSVLLWVISRLPDLKLIAEDSLESLRKAYRGNMDDILEGLGKAFAVLLEPDSWKELGYDRVLTNTLRCVERIVADGQASSEAGLEYNFKLLDCCETIVRDPRLPEAATGAGRKLRMGVAQLWRREWTEPTRRYDLSQSSFSSIGSYLANLRIPHRTEFVDYEDTEVLRVFSPIIRDLVSYWSVLFIPERGALLTAHNTLVLDICQSSQKIRKKARRSRDPDERWCHWHEESPSIKTLYTILPDMF